MDVFLADDEVMARILLRDLLGEQGSRFGVDVAGEAENGEELLRLLEKTRPDLVFVDIRMPLCDGLEVIRIANKRYEGIPWVIVSGFSEFAYAREAVRLGVIDYLVKPVEPEDLARVLEKAEEVMAARADEENARWEQACLEHVSTDPEFENFGDAMCGEDDRILLCRIDLEGDTDGDAENRLLDGLRDGLAAFRSRGNRADAVPLDPSTVMAICVSGEGDAGPSRADAAKRAVKAVLRETLGDGGSVRWSLCTEGFIPPGDVREAFAAAKRRSRLRFTAGLDREILPETEGVSEDTLVEAGDCAEGIADGVLSEPPSFPDEAAGKLGDLLGCLTKDERQKAFAGVRGYLAFRIADRRQDLEAAADPEELAILLAEIAKDVRPAPRGRATADRILEYVERHFREDIGVNTVADRFGLTPSYVSSLFKKKAGSTFVRYLAERRIREAKELILKRPDLTLREVSALSGFNNPRYFSKLFLRYVGMHPSEFRREA